jgi:hypothetical protein
MLSQGRTLEHIFGLCKLDENMHILVMEKCTQVQAKVGGDKGVVQHSLLVYRVIQGHLCKESFVFYHNFLGKVQHQNPSQLDNPNNFVPFYCHVLWKFYELQVPLR